MTSILIIGKGAIGTALGGLLQARGFAPFFIDRKGPAKVSALVKTPWNHDFKIETPAPNALMIKVCEAVFLPVKAYDLETALMEYLPALKPHIPIIPLCNGAIEGILTKVAAQFPQFLWRIGFSTLGVSQVSADRYEVRSLRGRFVLGPLLAGSMSAISPVEQQMCQVEAKPSDGAMFAYNPEISSLFHKKWLFNVVINSLTAAHKMPKNGLLLKDKKELKAVFEEAYKLGEEIFGAWLDKKEVYYDEMLRLIADTQDNENSMATDVRLGRKTESSFLAGLAMSKVGYPKLKDLHQKLSQVLSEGSSC